MRRINRLLRWYRALTHQPGVVEVTYIHVRPVKFFAASPSNPRSPYHDDLVFETPIQSSSLRPEHLEKSLREGLEGDSEPPVGELFLLDAESARGAGRFREAVLFSWSTIDAVFNTSYDRLVAARLSGERHASREFLQGKSGEVPLKVKMTALLSLVANKSLFSDRTKWEALSQSYSVRNKIIHAGGIATEADAVTAIAVARWVVAFMAGAAEGSQATL